MKYVPNLKALVFVIFATASLYAESPYLFVWAGDGDQKESDFLTVIDARSDRNTYGQVVATLPVGELATFPHHTEYEFPASSILFANGWAAGRTFLLDLNEPKKPRLLNQFKDISAYSFPHSFARLPNGNVLATFQVRTSGYEPPGALVEFDPNGKFIRASSADVAGMDKRQLWPYSLLVLPHIDRVVTSSTEMGLPKWALTASHGSTHEQHTSSDTRYIQVWRLSDLRLLATVPLPVSPDGKSHLNPAEPRLLPDGTVYVNTFSCGLFRVAGLAEGEPKAEFVYAFPGAETKVDCAVPVVVGKFWVQTDPSVPGLIAVDVSDPSRPVEVSRLVFDKRLERTHWIAADRAGNRLVVTGSNRSWVVIVNFDPKTGKMTLDEKFRQKGADRPGIDFDRVKWPHGSTGKALVHGALFGPAASK